MDEHRQRMILLALGVGLVVTTLTGMSLWIVSQRSREGPATMAARHTTQQERATATHVPRPIDLVVLIDTSPSMTYEASCEDGDDDDGDGVADDCSYEQYEWTAPTGTEPMTGVDTPDDVNRDPDICNKLLACRPFEDVRKAVRWMLEQLDYSKDRVSVISYDQDVIPYLDLTSDKASAIAAVQSLRVFKLSGCPGFPDPTFCTSTNIADALEAAAYQFVFFPRPEALRVVVLLGDGGANTATNEQGERICPGYYGEPTWIEPFCREPSFWPKHDASEAMYDAEDAAMDAALALGCPDTKSSLPAGCPAPGLGAVLLTVGLGDMLTENSACDPSYKGFCEPDQGEQLLRWIAGVGDDGAPQRESRLDLCASADVGESCGRYFYTRTGLGVVKLVWEVVSQIEALRTR